MILGIDPGTIGVRGLAPEKGWAKTQARGHRGRAWTQGKAFPTKEITFGKQELTQFKTKKVLDLDDDCDVPG